jgi:hypothetical protein
LSTATSKNSDESGFVRPALHSGRYRILATAERIRADRIENAVADASIVVRLPTNS